MTPENRDYFRSKATPYIRKFYCEYADTWDLDEHHRMNWVGGSLVSIFKSFCKNELGIYPEALAYNTIHWLRKDNGEYQDDSLWSLSCEFIDYLSIFPDCDFLVVFDEATSNGRPRTGKFAAVKKEAGE